MLPKSCKKLSYSDDTEGNGDVTAAPLGKAVSPPNFEVWSDKNFFFLIVFSNCAHKVILC